MAASSVCENGYRHLQFWYSYQEFLGGSWSYLIGLKPVFHLNLSRNSLFECINSLQFYEFSTVFSYSGIGFVNSPNKGKFRWGHDFIHEDMDGSLTGMAGHRVSNT